MRELLTALWKRTDIPPGVRVITLATAIRWIGWGFAENLIPVFIFSFGKSYAEAGLLKSGYDVALILGLPIAGMLADRLRASTLIIAGLFIYLFVGASYFLAGATGLAIYVVIARFLNGAAFALDSTGRGAYFRRHTPLRSVGTVFGYFDTVADFWWIVAALVGIFLIKRFSVPELLLLITPTALVALLIMWHFRKRETPPTPPEGDMTVQRSIREIVSWSASLKSMVVFNFFIAAAGGVVAFFLPIEAYAGGASLPAVILMGVVAMTPTLFGWEFGRLFDRRGARLFLYGILALAALLFALAFLKSYFWRVALYFGVNVILELLAVGSNELVTVHAAPEHFGQVDGIIRSITDIGMLAGPLAAGIAIDAFGVASSYLSLGFLMLFLAALCAVLRRRGFMHSRPATVQ